MGTGRIELPNELPAKEETERAARLYCLRSHFARRSRDQLSENRSTFWVVLCVVSVEESGDGVRERLRLGRHCHRYH